MVWRSSLTLRCFVKCSSNSPQRFSDMSPPRLLKCPICRDGIGFLQCGHGLSGTTRLLTHSMRFCNWNKGCSTPATWNGVQPSPSRFRKKLPSSFNLALMASNRARSHAKYSAIGLLSSYVSP